MKKKKKKRDHFSQVDKTALQFLSFPSLVRTSMSLTSFAQIDWPFPPIFGLLSNVVSIVKMCSDKNVSMQAIY